MSIQLTNPFAFLEFRYPQPSDEQQSQFYEIPAVKPSPLFQSLQDQTQKSAKEAAKGTSCAKCPRKTANQWYKNPQDPTSKICQACYNRIRRPNKAAEEAAKGTTCSGCSRTTARQWYTNRQNPTTKICEACYQRIHREKKAAEKAAKKATLLPVSPQSVSSPIPRNKRKKNSETQEAPSVSQKRIKPLLPIQNSSLQMDPPPFFWPPDALDEECFSLFSAIPGQSLEESGLPDLENEPPDALDEKCFLLFSAIPGQSLEELGLPNLENEQANTPINNPNDFLLEDSLLYEPHE